ncbi:MAG TPA: SRPBCC domain-containing protein [Flavobacteriia bacterium]|nr:SRPBCC domain-containing protein [Flavobacteriia bacterium]
MSKKIKFELEFPIHASSSFLHHYLATPDGLSEWFADNVNSRGEIFTFFWDGSEEKAKQKLSNKEEKVRYNWLDDEDDAIYFEFKIVIDDLTNDLALMVTDFAEEDEVEEQKMFWENQINTLKRCIGAA